MGFKKLWWGGGGSGGGVCVCVCVHVCVRGYGEESCATNLPIFKLQKLGMSGGMRC